MGAAPGNGSGTLAALARAVLDFAQDWRRAVILVGLGVAALLGTMTYQARDRLVAALEEFMRSPAPVRLDVDAAPRVAARLLAELPGHPRAVLVLAVDMRHNVAKHVAGAVLPEARAPYEALRESLAAGIPWLAMSRRNALAIALLNGALECVEPQDMASATELVIISLGIKTVCAVGVPPQMGELAGMILIGYPDAPVPGDELERGRPLLWGAGLELAGQAADIR